MKAKSTPKSTDKAYHDDSSDDECDPNERRSTLDEFAKRHGYNIPLYQQVSERCFKKMMRQHVARSLPVMKLPNVVVILDEQRFSEQENQITTSGGKLKIKKAKGKSSFHMSGPSFLGYLKTLLYGYAICSLRDRDTSDTLRFTLNAVLEYYDTFEQLVIRDANQGGAAKSLILQADLVLRTEMFRLNTLQPTLTGDELLDTVLASHASHLPTQAAIVDANKNGFVATPRNSPFTKNGGKEKTGDLCRLYADGKCRWGNKCRNVRNEKSRNPSPGMKKRLVDERAARQEKRRRIDNDDTRSVRRDTALVVLTWLS